MNVATVAEVLLLSNYWRYCLKFQVQLSDPPRNSIALCYIQPHYYDGVPLCLPYHPGAADHLTNASYSSLLTYMQIIIIVLLYLTAYKFQCLKGILR